MQIVENSPVVVIDIPRFCVPSEDADIFIQAANRFLAEIQDEMVEKFKSKRLKYDNRYTHSKFIPTVEETNSYSDILDMKVDVEQFDKYVGIDSEEERPSSDAVFQLWNPDYTEQEEEDE